MIAPADRCPTSAALGEWIALVAPELTGRAWGVVDIMQPQGAAGAPPMPYASVGHVRSDANGRPNYRQTREPAINGLLKRVARQQWTGTGTIMLRGPGAWDLAHALHLTQFDDRVVEIFRRWAVGLDPQPMAVEDNTEEVDGATWIEVMKLDLHLSWETRIEWAGLTIETAAVEIDAAGTIINAEASLTPPEGA